MNGEFSVTQPRATVGVKISAPTVLSDLLDLVEPCERWELRWITAVWWEGHESEWNDESWEGPVVLADGDLREEARRSEQITNGRFTGFNGAAETVMIEAVDSTFWLIWSEDMCLRQSLVKRFPGSGEITPPTRFHPLG